MLIKPCTSPFFLPLHFLHLRDIDLPGGSHCILWYFVTLYLDISEPFFFKKGKCFLQKIQQPISYAASFGSQSKTPVNAALSAGYFTGLHN